MTETQTALMQLTAEYRQTAGDIRDNRHSLDKMDTPDDPYCREHAALTFSVARGVEKLLEGRAVELEIARENAVELRRTATDAMIAWLPALAGGGGLLAGIGALLKGML